MYVCFCLLLFFVLAIVVFRRGFEVVIVVDFCVFSPHSRKDRTDASIYKQLHVDI